MKQVNTLNDYFKITNDPFDFYNENSCLLLKNVWPIDNMDLIRLDMHYHANGRFIEKLDAHYHKNIKTLHRCKKMFDIGDSILGDRVIPV